MSETLQRYASFYLGDTYLGVDVLKVQELLPPQQMTPVPRAPQDIRGLINLRGQIVPAVDLRRRLGMHDASPERQPMNVIIRSQEGLISLLVDRVGDVVDVPAHSFDGTSKHLAGRAARYTAGVHKLESCLLIVLDVDKVCEGDSSDR